MKNRHEYTEAQEKWLIEKGAMSMYRSKGGKLKAKKLRRAFEATFNITLTPSGIGWKVRHLTVGPYPSENCKICTEEEAGYPARG